MPETPRPRTRLTRGLAALLTACVVTSCGKKSGDDGPKPIPQGRSVVHDTVASELDPDDLAAMRWEDVVPTAEACSTRRLNEKTLAASEELSHPPAIYLRGLLKLRLGDTAGASAEWAAIDVAEIPPDLLYAPWRLAGAEVAGNRYAESLTAAVVNKAAGPLVRARFHGFREEWRECLDNYLRTDPADWSPFELRMFSLLKLQAPFSRDTAVLLAGALAGGRVPAALRTGLARLIKEDPTPDQAALAASLRENPALAQAATAAVTRALDLRQAFLSNRFDQVLAATKDTDPLAATDEVVLLTLLSAAKTKQTEAAERWAAEFLRRNPSDENRKWTKNILAEAR